MAVMAAPILDFERNILSFFIYMLPKYFPPSFESFGISVQEKKRKIEF